MKGMKTVVVILVLLTLTACASGTVYYEYQRPAQHVSVQTTVHHYRPIEVTLYANQIYQGRGLGTVHVVISDGEYVEIPLKNRRGHQSRIFAHYSGGVLHFDSNQNCQGIQGASRFKKDNGWHKGQMYTKIHAGKDFDLSGLRLKIRHVGQGQPPVVAQKDNPSKRQGTIMVPPYSKGSQRPSSTPNTRTTNSIRTTQKKSPAQNKPGQSKTSYGVAAKKNKQQGEQEKSDKPFDRASAAQNQSAHQPERRNVNVSKNVSRRPATATGPKNTFSTKTNNEHKETSQSSVAKKRKHDQKEKKVTKKSVDNKLQAPQEKMKNKKAQVDKENAEQEKIVSNGNLQHGHVIASHKPKNTK